MPKPKTGKSEDNDTDDRDAQAARERELRDLIEQAEAEKSGIVRPSNERPNDFVERKMREKFKN